jgi:hypothetical protein
LAAFSQAALALMRVTVLSPSFFLSAASQALACSMIETRNVSSTKDTNTPQRLRPDDLFMFGMADSTFDLANRFWYNCLKQR